MRISIHDLSDSDDEPAIVLNADADHSIDTDVTLSPSAARRQRSHQARKDAAIASTSGQARQLHDHEEDEEGSELTAGRGTSVTGVRASQTSTPTVPSARAWSVARGYPSPSPSPGGDRLRSARAASVEPARPLARGYTPYWSISASDPVSPTRPGSRSQHQETRREPFTMLSSSSSPDSDDELGSDDSTDDSEEEQWPVDPHGYRERKKERMRRKDGRSQSVADDEEVLRRIRLSAIAEPSPASPVRDNAWVTAASKYKAQAQKYLPQARITASPTTNALAFGLRGSEPPVGSPLARRQRTPFGLSVVSEEASRPSPGALTEVHNLLKELNMRQDENERRLQNEFEQRSQSLWDDIETAIREAEQRNAAEAAEKTAQLIAKRKEQEANERAARLAREAEQKRIEEEKERLNKEAEEAKKKAEEEARKQEAAVAEARRKEKEAAEADAARNLGGVGGAALWTQARDEYERLYSKIQDIKANVLPQVSGNPDWRKQCFMAKRQITPKISQLTNSRSEVIRITLAIADILGQAQNANMAIYTWILNHLSKCLIRQAEQEVAVKVDMAFPLARVVVWLILSGHTELGNVLMARMVKKCCYVVAYWPSKTAAQSDAEYRKQIGRPDPEETTHSFNSRMSGIFALYCAILQTVPTPPPTAANNGASAFGSASIPANMEAMPPHFRSERLWIWPARALTKPMNELPLTPTLLATCFEVAGHRALDYFGKQATKVWKLLLTEGIRKRRAGFVSKFVDNPAAEDGGAKAASARLQLLLEEWEKTGRAKPIPAANEMDP
ncbi:Nuclear pore complex nucleoporin component [Tilletia horrida]|nr:Nuclear pore complex nucleoporin component [Tilletia horrida]